MDSGSSASNFCPYDNLPCYRCLGCFVESINDGKRIVDVCSRFRAGSDVPLIHIYPKRKQ
jgi:hypothetical protein